MSAFILSSLLLTACGSAGSSLDSSDSTSDTTAETTVVTAEPDFPDVDFGGEEIRFLTTENPGFPVYTSIEIYAEEMDGSLLNDAVYSRNMKVEDRFNVEITENRVEGSASTARSSILAGDDEYDVVMPYMNDSISNALQGLYYNLYDVDNLHLENPWWDQRANNDLTVEGNLYFSTGDISILDNECTVVMFFNKQLIEDFSLDNPYEMVANGTWTFDKLFSMSSAVASDINGDSQMTNDADRFGIYMANNVPHSLFFASGERIASTDKDGKLQIVMKNERSTNIITYILESCKSDSIMRDYKFDAQAFYNSVAAFNESRLLFVGWALSDINSIRDCKFDFGILPCPKYDEAQSEYYSFISTICVPGVSIPVTNAEPEKAGLILEAMAYYSVGTLTEAYYDNALHTRYIRDEESGDMLDIIFASRVYDLGYISNIGGLGNLIMNLFTTEQTNFASRYAELESKASSDLNDLSEAFREAAGLN